MDSKSTKNLLFKNKNNSNKPMYKRSFPRANGSDFRFRPMSTEIINPENPDLFVEVVLHSNVKHPDFPNNKYGSNVRCLGKGCPLCRDYFKTLDLEWQSGIKSGGNAWKKRANKFAIYWMLDRLNKNQLTLVHLNNTPYMVKNKKTNKNEKVGYTLQELIFNKLVNATEKGLTPFNYQNGNDLVLRSKKVDNKTKWDIFVQEEKNDIPQEVINKLRKLPSLNQIYKPYTWEELECMVRGISLNNAKNIKRIVKANEIKEKEQKEKEEYFDENASLPTSKVSNEEVPKELKENIKENQVYQSSESKENSNSEKKNDEETESIEDSLMRTELDDENEEESSSFGDSINQLFNDLGEDNKNE